MVGGSGVSDRTEKELKYRAVGESCGLDPVGMMNCM